MYQTHLYLTVLVLEFFIKFTINPSTLAIVDMKNSEISHASLLRRFAAMVYDGLLCFTVLVVASALALPFMGGKGATEYNEILTVYFSAVLYFFFAWFWTHGGQTLGMRAWHTRLVTTGGQRVNWLQALYRYLVSLPMWFFWVMVIGKSTKGFIIPSLEQLPDWLLFLIATIWLVFDHLPNNWRDRLTGTCIVNVPKQNE
jgi:uncharacterized RDD family membrane protein YckC